MDICRSDKHSNNNKTNHISNQGKRGKPKLERKIKEQKQNPTHKSQIQNHTKSGIGERIRNLGQFPLGCSGWFSTKYSTILVHHTRMVQCKCEDHAPTSRSWTGFKCQVMHCASSLQAWTCKLVLITVHSMHLSKYNCPV